MCIFVAITGYVDPLDPDIEIEVPDDDSGLYAIDILDLCWVSP
jgi:phospholipase A1